MLINGLLGSPFLISIIASVIFGAASASAGVFISVKKETISIIIMSMASFIGILLSYLISYNPPYILSIILAFVSCLISSAIYILINKTLNVSKYSVQSIMSTALFGVAVTLYTILYEKGANIMDAERFFLGNTTTMTLTESYFLIIFSIIFLIILALFFKKFQIVLFDRNHASTLGINPRICSYIFKFLCIILILLGLQVTGIFFSGAIFIIPLMGIREFSLGFKNTIIFSAIFGMIIMFIGTFSSMMITRIDTGVSTTILAIIVMAIIKYGFVLKRKQKKQLKKATK